VNAFGKVFAAIALADRLASYGEPILITGLLKYLIPLIELIIFRGIYPPIIFL
jgi:hypothetical protein